MLGCYLNQTTQYQPCTGTDARGQPIFGEVISLPCRKQSKAQDVLTATGQTVRTQHVYYLLNKISEGDMLDGLIVMGVSEWVGLDGTPIGYKAVM